MALVLLAVTATTLAAVEIALSVRVATEHRVLVASLPAAGAGFALVGALAWSRRPANRTGLLLGVVGLLVLGATLVDTDLPIPFVRLGLLLGETPIGALLNVVLAFPSGRVPTRFDRGLVIALYAAVLVRQLPVALPGPDLEGLRTACSLVGAAILVVAAVRLALRVRAAPAGTGERWVLSVVYGYGMAFLLFLPFSARVLRPLLDLDATTLGVMQATGLAVVPFVFAAGVLRGGFAPTRELDELACAS